jgi:hypothetical protein
LKMRLALFWTGLVVEPSPEATELAMKQDVSTSLVAVVVNMVNRVWIDLSKVRRSARKRLTVSSQSTRYNCEGEGSQIQCYCSAAHGAENGLSDQNFTCSQLQLCPLIVGHAADCVCPPCKLYRAVVRREGWEKKLPECHSCHSP